MSGNIIQHLFGREDLVDLTVVVPSIRPEKIKRMADSLKEAVGEYSYELIVAGPYDASKIVDCLWLESLASPNLCVHKAIVEKANGKYVKWSTDDAVYYRNGISNLLNKMRGKDCFGVVKYTEEGPPGYPSGRDDIYYTAVTHADLRRLPGVKSHYKIAPVAIYHKTEFIALGGLDCRYEHINLSTHDLAFRMQEYGEEAIISDEVVMHCDSDGQAVDHRPLDFAHFNNDYPIFADKYKEMLNKAHISLANYLAYDKPWRRFQ
jgi:hypothetical protein